MKETNSFGLIELWFYEAFDVRFMPAFCNESSKYGVFSLNPNNYAGKQILTLSLILVELFSAVMSASTTSIAPIMSIIISVYAALSLYCFFDMPSCKLVKMMQSYFVAFKLSALCLSSSFEAYAY